MADEETKNAAAGAEEARRTPVGFTGKRIPTSYANAFRTRVVDGMVCVSYGVSYAEAMGQEQGLAVDMERRIIMTPDAAGRLINALARLLRPAAPAGEADTAGTDTDGAQTPA